MRLGSLALAIMLGACAQTHRSDFELRGMTHKVSGVVRSAEGLPIPYAGLTAMRTGGGCLITTFDSGSTDDRGRYTLEVPYPPWSVTIHVRAEGWAHRSFDLKGDETNVDLTLTRCVEQTGVVTDARGAPLEDVIIRSKGG